TTTPRGDAPHAPGATVSAPPLPDAVPVIELDGVSKSFDGTLPAVDGVTLSVPAGQFLAIVGGSGSGKTTTLKTINRLIEADAGEVRVAGEPAAALPPHELRRRI